MMCWLQKIGFVAVLQIAATNIGHKQIDQNTITTASDRQDSADRVVNDFYQFLSRRPNQKSRNEMEEKHTKEWGNIQQERLKTTATLFNASILPHLDHFTYSRLTGLSHGERPYRVGTLGQYAADLLTSLPGTNFVPRLTWLWKYLVDGEEKKLKGRLADKMRRGEAVFTNRRRSGGLLLRAVESSPWWHRGLAWCSSQEVATYGPEDAACSLLLDLGLTLVSRLAALRELMVCAALTLAAGDSGLCLALVISKLAFPGWAGDGDTPWLANNVHL